MEVPPPPPGARIPLREPKYTFSRTNPSFLNCSAESVNAILQYKTVYVYWKWLGANIDFGGVLGVFVGKKCSLFHMLHEYIFFTIHVKSAWPNIWHKVFLTPVLDQIYLFQRYPEPLEFKWPPPYCYSLMTELQYIFSVNLCSLNWREYKGGFGGSKGSGPPPLLLQTLTCWEYFFKNA